MNMEEINVNSMDYRKLSKEDKSKIVKFKINKILNSTDSNKICVYYKDKKVSIPKDNANVFKDLCEREKKLEKYVTISEEQEVEKPVIDAEVVRATNNDENNKKVTRGKLKDLNLEEVNNQIGFVKNYMDRIALLYKTVEYKDADIIEIQGYTGNSVFVPFSEQGHYQALYKYLRLLENRKVELEVAEIDKHLASDSGENTYEYLSEDDNPYETGYMQFATNSIVKKAATTEKVESTAKIDNNSSINSEVNNQEVISNVNDVNTIIPNNECNDLAIVESNTEEHKKDSLGKKALGFIAGTSLVGGICNFGKKIGSKVKNKVSKAYTATKKKVNDIGDILRKNDYKTAVCTGIVTIAIAISSFLPRIIGKRVKPADTTKPSSVVEVTDTTVKEDTIDNSVVEIPNAPTEEVTKFDDYDLGEEVNVEDNSYIYTNSYDATDKVNEYTPYFDNSYAREVAGVTYELEGNLYTIYKNDVNASDKINELISRGAKQTAALVVCKELVNTGDYEGYYNVNSLTRVKTK